MNTSSQKSSRQYVSPAMELDQVCSNLICTSPDPYEGKYDITPNMDWGDDGEQGF